MFSGPVLGLCVQGDSVLVGRGPYVHRGSEPFAVLPTATVHGIKHLVEETIVFGCRELKIGNILIQTRDWILDVIVTDQLILVAVMHNRLEVYSFTDSSFICTIDCPSHALLYSACIYMATPNRVCFIGGGVMCDMHFWSVSLRDFQVLNHRVVSHHKGSIFRIRFSDQFGTILSTSDDRSVCVWTQTSPSEWQVSQTLLGHQSRVWDSVHVTRDMIATACEDGLIRIFESGRLIKTLSGHERDVRVLAPGCGMSLYSGGEDGSVRKWNLQPDIVHAFDWPLESPSDDWIRGVHLLSENEMVVASNFGSFSRVSDGKVIRSVSCDTGKSAVVCSALAGSQLLVAGLSDGSMILWNMQSSELIRFSTLVSVRCASVFPDGDDTVIVANHCGELVTVNLTSREVIRRVELTRNTKPSGKLSSFLRVDKKMIFGDDKGFIYIVGTNTAVASCLVSRSDKVVSLERSETSSSFIINMNNGTSVEFDLLESRIGTTRTKAGFASFVCKSTSPKIGFSGTDFVVHDSNGIQFHYTCGGHRRPFDFKVSSEKSHVVFAFAVNNRTARFVSSPFISETVIQGCNGDLIHGIVSLGGNRFMTANEDNKLRIVSSKVKTISVHEGSVRAIARVGSFIVSGGARSQIVLSRIDDLGSVIVVQSINLPGEDDVRIMGIAGTRNEFLAVTSACEIYRFSVSLLGISDVERIPAPSEMSASVLLSVVTDGDSFCIGSGNGYLFRLRKSGVSACMRVHQSGVNAIVATPDYLISAGDDQSICVTRKGDFGLISKIELASACSIRALAVGVESGRLFSTGTDRLLSEWSLNEQGNLSLISQRKLAVTDPLSLLTRPEGSIIVGGRGLEILE